MLWFTAHLRRLQLVLRRRGHSREDAEDLIHEAFLRVQAYCDDGGEVREQEAFLVRSVLNLARDAHQRAHLDLYERQPVEELTILDTSPRPDEVLDAQQRLAELRAALNAINPRTCEAFFLHRVEGLSYAQIADHLDISVSAVEKHIAKAMSAVGRRLLQP
ncbi:MAG TPA: sigma-70 family RNA polymerase sigma factor [Steroidobacter sp.]